MIGTPLDWTVVCLYFVGILALGFYFGRNTRTTKDFFFAGRRFSWHIICMSLVATVVGSYSFIKYSEAAFKYGISSSQTYLNDWIWLPILTLVWIPIIYFGRIESVPEFFEKRFGVRVRVAVTVILLIYMLSYIGINFLTLGTAIHSLTGERVPVWGAAAVVATCSAIYVFAGGQSSVIMTDLIQGALLLAAGIAVFWLGIDYMGGLATFAHALPEAHRNALPEFNRPQDFNFVGIFWQDGIANTAMFYLLNQGLVMRFLSARSIRDARKAMWVTVIILMPIAAIAVSGAGWIGRALWTRRDAGLMQSVRQIKSEKTEVSKGSEANAAAEPSIEVEENALTEKDIDGHVFVAVTNVLTHPGIFGLILAALTAALMSTADTLINAVSAVAINDVFRPYLLPGKSDRDYLKLARVIAVVAVLIGLGMVPVYQGFKSIYSAHGCMTASVTPPLVAALLFSIFSRRFSARACFWTIVFGSGAIIASLVWPQVITPFNFGIEAENISAKSYKFIRAFFGIAATTGFGMFFLLLDWRRGDVPRTDLGWWGIGDLMEKFKGAPVREVSSRTLKGTAMLDPEGKTLQEAADAGSEVDVTIGDDLAKDLQVKPGDILFVSPPGLLKFGRIGVHARCKLVDQKEERQVRLSADVLERLTLKPGDTIKIQAII